MEKVHVNVVDINPVVDTVKQTAEEAHAASYCCYIKDQSKILRLFFLSHQIFVCRILNSLRL